MRSVGTMTEHIVVAVSPTTLFNQQIGVADSRFFHFSQKHLKQNVSTVP